MHRDGLATLSHRQDLFILNLTSHYTILLLVKESAHCILNDDQNLATSVLRLCIWVRCNRAVGIAPDEARAAGSMQLQEAAYM